MININSSPYSFCVIQKTMLKICVIVHDIRYIFVKIAEKLNKFKMA